MPLGLSWTVEQGRERERGACRRNGWGSRYGIEWHPPQSPRSRPTAPLQHRTTLQESLGVPVDDLQMEGVCACAAGMEGVCARAAQWAATRSDCGMRAAAAEILRTRGFPKIPKENREETCSPAPSSGVFCASCRLRASCSSLSVSISFTSHCANMLALSWPSHSAETNRLQSSGILMSKRQKFAVGNLENG